MSGPDAYGGAGVERVLVIGHGYAGSRFVAAIEHLIASGRPLVMAGICDRNGDRLPDKVPGFTDIGVALRSCAPTVICVTVNEADHVDTYRALTGYRRSLVLSEKPLTADSGDVAAAVAALSPHEMAMNLIERYSPVVREFRQWLAERPELHLVRVESFWGKHRIGDARPTIGVLSEIVHPIDLVRYLFPGNEFRWRHGHGFRSDFSPHSPAILDSLDVVGDFGQAPIILHSSYTWAHRLRTIWIYLESPNTGLIRAELVFDTPHWDCDRLDISTIDRNGRYESTLRQSVSVTALPEAIRGIGKLVEFVDIAVRQWRDGVLRDDIVDLHSAVQLQETTDRIERVLDLTMAPTSYYPPRERAESHGVR
ncbi:Gfo/Idh/MocA family oxidoreductase [Nocardia uniformis]|uniref:Gfo/Idh/MocA family oxidoreductase n=1 Tax=Nocardia uniformis TaxID=53432 RepID=A0A849CFU0_9NOCA|nr:Gfo/Idh/MocA family oxidoreductase [Nocardia uniformis]NNH75645.1 Gfo/Idh/MocA family oxidoreductase [Nocardia uniformis]